MPQLTTVPSCRNAAKEPCAFCMVMKRTKGGDESCWLQKNMLFWTFVFRGSLPFSKRTCKKGDLETVCFLLLFWRFLLTVSIRCCVSVAFCFKYSAMYIKKSTYAGM